MSSVRNATEPRGRHVNELAGLLIQSLLICDDSRLISLREVSIDDAKTKANASSHKAIEHRRIKTTCIRLKDEI